MLSATLYARLQLRTAAILAGALGVWTLLVAPVAAQLRDSFEGPQATWTLKEADCGVSVLIQERSYRQSHGGQASEHLRLAVGSGTFVYLTQSIGRAAMIAEFRPSLFLKSDRPSLQLMARVVLPHTIDPGTKQPLSLLLRGDVYTDVGQWQELAVRDATKLLDLEIIAKRTVFRGEIDPREAYVDLLVLNAYSTRGNIDLWLDDLEIQGYVNLDEADSPQIARRASPAGDLPAGSPAASRAASAADAPGTAQLQGSLLLVRGRPFAPRIIRHQGEPFEWLQTLGFNTIQLAASPSPQQLKEAQRLGLWLVAPPPYGDESLDPSTFSPVIGWSLGARLTERDLAGTKELVSEIRRFEPNQQRPLVIGADAGLGELSRVASLLIHDRNPLGTAQELSAQRGWLIARPRLTRPGTPMWAAVHSQRPHKLAEQLVLLSQGASVEEDTDPEQLRLSAYSALAAGARGFVFPSSSPLGIDRRSAALRTDALKLLNMELKLFDPWIAAGTLSEELAAGDHSVQVSVLSTDRSRLLLVTQHAPAQQYVLGPAPQSSLQVTVPGVSASDKAYRVSLGGIKSLRVTHSGSGAHLTLDDAGLATAVVITQDPLAIHHLKRTLSDVGVEAARLRYDIAVRRLGQTVELDGELAAAGHPLAGAPELLREAQAHLDRAGTLLTAGDYENLHLAISRGEQALAKVRRGHWEQTAAPFPSPAASPCLAQFTSLPLHWQLAQRMQQGQWGGNEQAAGDFESLDQMLQTGWQQQRLPPAGVQCDVSLSLQNPHSGRSALRMQAWAAVAKSAPPIVEQPLVWIGSSPVPVRQGQLVRIHAWVHVPRPLAGTADGLLVFDSAGGAELADRVRLTQGWRELTLYRAVPETGELSVTFALTGLGEAWIDDLSVSLLDPEPIRP
ncbi:MAG: hypothetical protein WD872_15770 [Pirellulaceae bacterium]